MISAVEFIDILEEKDLLEPELIDEMRRRVEQSMAPVSAALLAKRLVDKGHLSRKLAQRLLDRADTPEEAPVETPPEAPVGNDKGIADLGLAPLEDEEDEEELVEEVVDLESTEDEDWGLQELDDEPPIQPAAPATPPATPIQPAPPAPTPAQPAPLEGLEGLEELAGPLDGLDASAAVGEPVDDPLGGTRRGRRARRGKVGKGAKKNVWESNLLLLGGGSLLFLIIVGIVLFFVLKGRGADDMIAQADEYYETAAYTQAEDSYTTFIDKFPSHEEVGRARVRLCLARLRIVVSSGQWPEALELAQEEIQKVSGEDTFSSVARPELASMLPDIAEGLAKEAHSKHDGALADSAENALAVVEKYVTSSNRPQEKLQEVVALIALTRREIARGERLQQTVAEMNQAAEEGRTQDGYDLRRSLLKDYTVLRKDPSLAEAVRNLSRAEQAAVQSVEKSLDSVKAAPEQKADVTIGLAQRALNGTVRGAEQRHVFAVAGGAVYGLDAADGKVVWRQDIGFEVNLRGPQPPPIRVSDRSDADPILVSRTRQEVIRVDAASGEIRWRFPVGEPFDAHPVVFDDRVLIATLSGRLISLDVESGNSPGYTQIPQPLQVGPTPDDRQEVFYQVGEHSSLFVLSASDGSCGNVIYLGHEPGTIVVPPIRVSRYLLVCENAGVHDGVVKVLDMAPEPQEGEETAPPIHVVQQAPLEGHVHTHPMVDGSRIVLVTDTGAITVLELTAKTESPLRVIAEGRTATDEEAELVRYAAIDGGRIWVADSQLAQYAVRANQTRLTPSWIDNEHSVSLQPPEIAGQAVIQVRHRRGLPGVAVTAASMENGEPVWETVLAAPAAAPPIADALSKTLIATTTIGGVFQMEPPRTGTVAINDQPSRTISAAELTAPIEQVVRVPSGLIALIPGGEPIGFTVFEPGKDGGESRMRLLQLPEPLTGEVVEFAGGLLVPCRNGQVFLLDARSGEEMLAPFQPSLETGRDYRWSRPAIIEKQAFVIADDSGGVHRVTVEEGQPKKYLAGKASVRLDEPIVSPIAVLGDRAYGVDRSDSLVSLDAGDLTEPEKQVLGARCVLGPAAVGQHVILVTDDGFLHVIDSEGNLRKDGLTHGTPLGEPAVDGADWLFASADGVVWRANPGSGEELAARETGLALGSTVVPFGSRVLAAGHDGTLYLIEKP